MPLLMPSDDRFFRQLHAAAQLTPDERSSLNRLLAEIAWGRYADDRCDEQAERRLAFYAWLHERGKLTDWPAAERGEADDGEDDADGGALLDARV